MPKHKYSSSSKEEDEERDLTKRLKSEPYLDSSSDEEEEEEDLGSVSEQKYSSDEDDYDENEYLKYPPAEDYISSSSSSDEDAAALDKKRADWALENGYTLTHFGAPRDSAPAAPVDEKAKAARLKLKQEMRDYSRRTYNLSVYDAIAPPSRFRWCGGIRPLDITNPKERPILTDLCEKALKFYYKCNKRNRSIRKDPAFVFHQLLRCTSPAACAVDEGTTYYITFQAKQEPAAALTTFQTHVDYYPAKDPHFIECVIKKN